jgi:hypothetical protein
VENRILGARVRELRRQAGLSQAELARRLEISPSYLNLIEHNKRRIAGALLRRTAAALDVAVDDLDGAAHRVLLDDEEKPLPPPDRVNTQEQRR